MTLSNFKIIFGIQFLHSYFNKSICDCLAYSPSEETKKLMERYRMGIDKNINGFKLFVNTQFSLIDILTYIKDKANTTYLDFDIRTNNSKFYFFTDFPIDWTGYVLYNSQIISNQDQDGTIKLQGELSENTDTSILAKLRIYIDDIITLKKSRDIIEYDIIFQSRATQWQYYIINKSKIVFNDPSIFGKSDIQFEVAKNVTIQNGQDALLFSSGKNLLPLSQKPKYKFDLVNSKSMPNNSKKKSTYKPIFSGLPNPDPARIGTERVNDKNLVISPMYVYV
ncbi:hypothetical protein [uncultured Winogradskyella sp.]|uniref:hypothetical protein n=1 Tax=uncultured Winogradskyella sp. TaxID=395353 RepID=UPI0026257306|nr:hypothetical protein [uncultured Winogradskyella sp.]